jgi:hypothetical protein
MPSHLFGCQVTAIPFYRFGCFLSRNWLVQLLCLHPFYPYCSTQRIIWMQWWHERDAVMGWALQLCGWWLKIMSQNGRSN